MAALQSMNDAALAVGSALSALSEALTSFGCQVYVMAWYAYLKAGAPYGETRAGLDRWITENYHT